MEIWQLRHLLTIGPCKDLAIGSNEDLLEIGLNKGPAIGPNEYLVAIVKRCKLQW